MERKNKEEDNRIDLIKYFIFNLNATIYIDIGITKNKRLPGLIDKDNPDNKHINIIWHYKYLQLLPRYLQFYNRGRKCRFLIPIGFSRVNEQMHMKM